jgi:hypothetical protein
MTTLLLALLPLSFVFGFLTWVMLMGARDQERSDKFALAWVEQNRSLGKR